jgi:hypothetical protein
MESCRKEYAKDVDYLAWTSVKRHHAETFLNNICCNVEKFLFLQREVNYRKCNIKRSKDNGFIFSG